MTKEEILKRCYGYDQFRPGQAEVIDALLQGRDVLDIMPTGGGKSVCYQVPALLLPGVTLVISPLLSLMRDQVMALVHMGIPAAYLNSSLTYPQYCLALRRAREGCYKLIYVAPERLSTPGFLDFALSADIRLVAVDEAHCISHWGPDFRPAYLEIPDFIQNLPVRPAVGAFTATATEEVQEDIAHLLCLRHPLRQISGFDRSNLYFEVRRPEEKRSELLRILMEHQEECGIVYCSTRKYVETVCAFLCDAGLSATRYHAGLEPEERQQNQEDFLFDRARIMVATNAFGMGIDKSDVRFVVHYNMPMDLESYYQEAGRAGRDGAPASCILLYSGGDVMTARYLITNGTEDPDPERQSRDLARLDRMAAYCRTKNCLRHMILDYFGEPSPDRCDNCSNCTQDFQKLDVSDDARQILQCVKDTGQRFGQTLIVRTLRGSRDARLLECHLDATPTYGALASRSREDIRELIQFLSDSDYLTFTHGEYPVLRLTAEGSKLLSGQKKLTMRVAASESSRSSQPAHRAKKDEQALTPVQERLMKKLREKRLAIAQREGTAAYIIAHDKTLRELAVRMPRTMAQLLEINGIGKKKAELYGEEILSVIAEFRRGQGLS